MRRATVAALVAVLGASPGWAVDPCATTVGTVSGTVSAAGGGPIAGARVRVQDCLGAPAVTDANGAFTVAVPAGAVVVASAASGFFNGCYKQSPASPDCDTVTAGATALAIALDPLPAVDDPTYVYRDPASCQECHGDVVDQWNRSTMSHTNRNIWVDKLYNGTDATAPPGPPPDPNHPPFFAFLARHNPDAAHPIRYGECANCHQPTYVAANPTNTDFNLYEGQDSHGITCDFCHRIADVDVSPDGIRRPNLVPGESGAPPKTTMLRTPDAPGLIFGPLDDVTFPGGTEMRAAHAEITRSSRLCAACHEDSTDPRDPAGNFLGTYDGPASQMTYTEWAQSSYAQQGIECVDCHMPPSGADRFCSRSSNVRDPSQVRSHTFEGTTLEFLQRAVTLATTATVESDQVTVDVSVTNSGAGHWLPTGVTLRNIVLLVDAIDRSGVHLDPVQGDDGGPIVPEWGGSGDRSTGAFAGLPGKIYARVLYDEFFTKNVLFTIAVGAFDNRIPAGATDTTHYAFQLPHGWQKRDVRVDVKLYYRRAFKPFADQRKLNIPLNGNAHGTRGDGTDYDENLVMASTSNLLNCRGKVAKLRGATFAADGPLELSGVLKLPAGIALDAAADGVRVAFGDPSAASALVRENVQGFTPQGDGLQHDGAQGDAVGKLVLVKGSKRAYRVTLDLDGLDPVGLTGKKLQLGLDSGDVCFRKPLRCKTKGGRLRCR